MLIDVLMTKVSFFISLLFLSVVTGLVGGESLIGRLSLRLTYLRRLMTSLMLILGVYMGKNRHNRQFVVKLSNTLQFQPIYSSPTLGGGGLDYLCRGDGTGPFYRVLHPGGVLHTTVLLKK